MTSSKHAMKVSSKHQGVYMACMVGWMALSYSSTASAFIIVGSSSPIPKTNNNNNNCYYEASLDSPFPPSSSSSRAKSHTHPTIHFSSNPKTSQQQAEIPSIIDSKYYTPPEPSIIPYGNATRVTLSRFLTNLVKANPEFQDLQNILLALELSCKTISNLVNRAGLVYSIQNDEDNDEDGNYSDGRYYSMKRLDTLSTTVLKNALRFTGTVQMIAPDAQIDSEQPKDHQPGVLIAYDENFVACLDPLDGSGNADASICTGTVFGVFARNQHGTTPTTTTTTTANGEAHSLHGGVDGDDDDDSSDDLLKAVLQPARNMRAAGYCLYSSATVLVFTLANGVYGFTLDPQIQEFVLTHDNLTIPRRGNVYSCNEANSEGWNTPWKTYLRNLKLGQGETQTRYAHRYVGSMVGDIHRTLLYGGIFAYPSDSIEKPRGNLQLLYKVAPMAFVVHHAGGIAIDEDGNNLLDMKPERIHQKSPCFMGSPQDVLELEKYLKKLESSK